MQRAIEGLNLQPTLVLIDGRSSPQIDIPLKTIIKGDQSEKCISAASIIAKVTRDSMMNDYHLKYPEYNFKKHKGYSTKEHQQLLMQYGACSIHRRSFSRVKSQIVYC